MREELRFKVFLTEGLLFVSVYCGYQINDAPEILVRLIDHLQKNKKPVRTLAGEFPRYELVLKALDHLLIQYKIESVRGLRWDSIDGTYLTINIVPRRV